MTREVFVWRELECRYDFEGRTKDELIKYLSSLSDIPTEAYLDIGIEDDYGSTRAYVKWSWKELESAQEKETRERQEKTIKEYRRKQYEQLAKEFGK